MSRIRGHCARLRQKYRGRPPAVRALRTAVRVREASFGTFALARGIAYLPHRDELPEAVRLISGVVPVEVWAWLWMGAAACMYASAVHNLRWSTYPAIAMCLVWAVGYLFSWAFRLGDQSPYLAAVTYVLWAAVIIAGTVVVSIALRLARLVYPESQG